MRYDLELVSHERMRDRMAEAAQEHLVEELRAKEKRNLLRLNLRLSRLMYALANWLEPTPLQEEIAETPYPLLLESPRAN